MKGSHLTAEMSSIRMYQRSYQVLRKVIPAAILLVILSLNLSAQTTADSLRITDIDTKAPIGNVHIYLNDSLIGISHTNGTYRLRIPLNQKDSLSFTCIGYQKKKVGLTELQSNRYHIALVQDITYINEVDIYGKKQELKTAIRYTQLASFPEEIHSFASAIYNDTIYVHGGIFSKFNLDQHIIASTLYKYSINDDKWSEGRKDFKKRASHAMHVYNDKLYIIGGQTYFKNIHRTYLENGIEIYDIHTGKITAGPVNNHTAIHFASCLQDHSLIMMGGTKRIWSDINMPYGEKKFFTNHIRLLDLKTEKWYKIGETAEGQESTGVLIDNKIYLVGGHSFKQVDTIESYNLSTGQTTVESRLIHPASRPAVTSNGPLIYVFNKGLIYIFHTTTKETKAYVVDLLMEDAYIHYHDNKLYILGGRTDKGVVNLERLKKEDQISRGLYCIDIAEFDKTADVYHSLMP